MTRKKTVLSNGLTIITDHNEKAFSTMLTFWVKAGGNHETSFPFGIAHFLEHMMFKGTKKRTKDEINEHIDEIGGIFNASTWPDKTRYYTTVPFDRWKVGVDVLTDMMFSSLFPENEIETEKKVVFEEIKRSQDDPANLAYNILTGKLRERQPERQSVLGTPESVGSITRDDLLRFVDTYYIPSNMTFVATGNIQHDELVSYIEQLVPESDKKVNADLSDTIQSKLNGEVIHIKRDIAQAHLRWSLYGPKGTEDDAIVMSVIGTLLGGSMSSRLFKKIREERGLAYTASAGYSGNTHEGFLMGYVGTDPTNADEVMGIIIDELDRLKTEPVGDKELNKVKQSKIGRMFTSQDYKENINAALAIEEMFNLPFNPEQDADEIQNVTADDIMRVANTYFGKEKILFAEVSNR